MSVEACWTVRFGPTGEGGIAVLESGRLYGGDSGYAYLGTYTVAGDQVTGNLRIIRHNDQINSIFGNMAEFNLTFSATRVNENVFNGTLNHIGFPAVPLRLTRLAELP